MYVGLAADVGAILDSKFIYVTEDEFQEHLSDPNAHKDLFSKFQTKTNLLQETSVIETGDYVPIYHPIDNTHYKVDLQKFFTAVRNVLFSGIDGIVKANKNGTVSKAIEGEDYQLPTNKLVSGSTLDDTDIDERDLKIYNGWRRNRTKRGLNPNYETAEEREEYWLQK